MIKTKTVFVVGAGACKPYGFPTGAELRNNIISSFGEQGRIHNIFKDDRDLSDNEKHMKKTFLESCGEFSSNFDESNISSIDKYLSINRTDQNLVRIGKMAIVYEILKAEIDHLKSRKKKYHKQHWLYFLYNSKMTDEITIQEDYRKFSDNNVCFITFNYDRMLEHFLYTSLRKTFLCTSQETIKDVLDKIDIIHVYGKIAPLDWQEKEGLPFGNHKQEPTYDMIKKLKDNIRIVYDDERSTEENEHVIHIQKKIHDAEIIYFLGFGWDQQNMKILGIPEVLNKSLIVLATTHGLLDQEVKPIYKILKQPRGIEGQIAVRFGGKNCDCLKCLREGKALKNRLDNDQKYVER